jgi:Icc-related predicted phosphoesterase
VRVLALADKPPPLDPALMAEQMGADAVICVGDLDRAWIESLERLDLPRIGVHGNHDEPGLLREVDVQDLDGTRTSLGGMTFAGFEGCVRYGNGGPFHYTQREGVKRARKLPAADVLVTHCPPLGINDDPDDPAHVGFEGLLEWVRRYRPRHLLHGHVHPLGGRVMSRFEEDTRVHWISGARMVVLD